jgi:hypothetical protein
MSKELPRAQRREASNSSRNQTRQSGLNHSENKVAVPTWDGQHHGLSCAGHLSWRPSEIVGIISKEHIADSVAESIKPFGKVI